MLAGSSRHLHEIAAFCTQHGSLDCTHLEQSAVLVEQFTLHIHILLNRLQCTSTKFEQCLL